MVREKGRRGRGREEEEHYREEGAGHIEYMGEDGLAGRRVPLVIRVRCLA